MLSVLSECEASSIDTAEFEWGSIGGLFLVEIVQNSNLKLEGFGDHDLGLCAIGLIAWLLTCIFSRRE